MRWTIAAVTIALIAVTIPGTIFTATASPTNPEGCAEHLVHPPIVITEDVGPQGFILGHDPVTAEPIYRPGSGVVSGDGTADNPYLIAGWCVLAISGFSSNILIQDTTAHVVLHDNFILGTQFNFGVQLDDADHVTIRNNAIISHFGNGVNIFDGSEDIMIHHNRITNNTRDGIRYVWSDGLSVQDNIISHNDRDGIRLSASTGISIHGNNIHDNHYQGVTVFASGPVDATENWWGSSDGPSGGEEDPCSGETADGDGDKVDSEVCFDPWLTEPNPNAGPR